MTRARCQDVAPGDLAGERVSNRTRIKGHGTGSRGSAELMDRLTVPDPASIVGVGGRIVSAADPSEVCASGAEWAVGIELGVDRRVLALGGQDAWPWRLLASARKILSMCHPPGPADVTTRQAGADPAFRWRT